MTYVYNLRYLSEDSNPWDSNQSFGIFAKLQDAQKFGSDWMKEEDHVWAPLEGGVYTDGGYVDGWYLTEPDEIDPDDGKVCGDYGMHITKEELK